MKNPTFVIDTSDSRMFYTMRYISSQGYTTSSLTNYDNKGNAVYCFSPSKRFTAEELLKLTEGSVLACGNLPAQSAGIVEGRNIKYYNLLLDEVFSIENAIQTAEAALMLIIRATNTSIFEQRTAIFGYGRLGRALAKLYTGLGLNFAICTNDYYERASAHLSCKDVYDISAPLDGFDVIINTIPAKVLPLERLKNAVKCSYILDLASYSSVDVSEVESVGITYDNALGLPGKYSPKSAGEILAKAILNIQEVEQC